MGHIAKFMTLAAVSYFAMYYGLYGFYLFLIWLVAIEKGV